MKGHSWATGVPHSRTLDLPVDRFRVRRENAAEFPRHVQAAWLSVSTQFDHADNGIHQRNRFPVRDFVFGLAQIS